MCLINGYNSRNSTNYICEVVDKKTIKIALIGIYILIAIVGGILCILARPFTPHQIGFGIKKLEIAALVFSGITLTPIALALLFGCFGLCVAKSADCTKKNRS